jgi:lactoylglutathione lyase
VVYASDVGRTARFWERLGFTRFYQLPGDGEPEYVALRRGDAELAVVAGEWTRDQYGLSSGDGPRFEMFVYADDVDRLFDDLRAEGVTVLRDPADMPWGERIASIADPDCNPVTLANERPAARLGQLAPAARRSIKPIRPRPPSARRPSRPRPPPAGGPRPRPGSARPPGCAG